MRARERGWDERVSQTLITLSRTRVRAVSVHVYTGSPTREATLQIDYYYNHFIE